MTNRHLSMRTRLLTVGLAAVPIIAAAMSTGPVSVAASTGSTRQISAGGSGGFRAVGGASSSPNVQQPETPSASTDGAVGNDRSHSAPGASTPVGAATQPKPVTATTPNLLRSFDGLNHFDQRFGTDQHGNQFSLEPPDQGLCVGSDGSGNTRVLETLNDVTAVYDTHGTMLSGPEALNTFFGYPPAIIRGSDPTFGPFVTDPSCLYDAASGHWFMVVLTIDVQPKLSSDNLDHFTGTNHIDIAVSTTSDPAGDWTVNRLPVQDDGTQGTPNHGCSAGTPYSVPPFATNPTACFGDYPHIGSDANGFYVTTNEYSFFGPEFHGAQVYAFSKAQLASLSPTLTVTQFDTHGMDTFGFALNGFTLWPSQTPGGGGDSSAAGAEYFLSTNGGAEAHDTGDGTSTFQASHQLLVWALTNTSSLSSGTPSLSLSSTEVNVGTYTLPPKATQKSGNQPLRTCLNNNSCILNVLGEPITDPFSETSAALDSNDTRMQQVTWVDGHLWGAIDTGLSVSSAKQAGVEWFNTTPSTSTGAVTASLAGQGYVGLGNDNLTYPTIGLTSAGRGVMAFTLVGADYYPSAGYAMLDNSGVGSIHIAAAGQGPDDGFTDYKFFGPTFGVARPRWGDYGAAVAMGDNVWMASEYIGQSCSFAQWEKTGLRCGSTRSALGNWDTRISEVSVP